MRLSRRGFLALALAAAGVVLARGAWLVERGRAIAHGCRGGARERGTPGPLPDAAVATLVAATAELLGGRAATPRYEDFLRWRARHVPGAREAYRTLADALDAGARARGFPGLAASPPALRAAVMAEAYPRHPPGQWRRRLLHPRADRAARRVRREVLRLFARTDAWECVGYPGPPGPPRGFGGLSRPPAGA